MLDTLYEWCENNHPIAAGLILLVAAFILSFCYKTAWGEWKKRK